MWQKLHSELDQSVNFVIDAPDGGKVEARYVRRCDNYFICYLSSHTGCDRACRMCHLTATGQTMFSEIGRELFLAQADQVLDHYHEELCAGAPAAQRVNFNWMARGEPLANRALRDQWSTIHARLGDMASFHRLEPRYHVSTIMPAGFELERDMTWLCGDAVTVYYSVYSTDESFRKRWLPKAMPVHYAMGALAWWQGFTGGEIVLHGPFIRGENDDARTTYDIIQAAQDAGLRLKRFNHVAYNPPNDKSAEADEEVIELRLAQYREYGIETRRVPRVGFDVKASCGMFVGGRAR